MSEALAAVYPATTLQTCIVHLLRHSLDFANWRERKPLAAALDAFAAGPRGKRFLTNVASRRRAWPHVIPLFAVPPAIRRVLYTTNALESVHAQLRRILQTRGHFPTDAAATKLIWVALRNITATWWKAANYWHLAMNQFAMLYEDRFTRPLA